MDSIAREDEKILEPKILSGFFIAAVCALALTPIVRAVAARLGIVEKPNGRARRDIAHIGGVAIVGAVLFALIPMFLFVAKEGEVERSLVPVLVASGFLVFLVGIVDDLRSLHYSYKLILQIAVSVFIGAVGLALLYRFSVIRIPVLWLAPLLVGIGIWMLLVTTSFNLIDGVDGLASGLACIAALAYAFIGSSLGEPLVTILALVVFGAALGFLRYNFPPASIFMGDSGSLFLGLLFGLISMLLLIPGRDLLVRMVGNVSILAVPILDTALAFSRRLMMGRPIFEADHLHIHHMLLQKFRSARKVDAVLWSFGAVMGLLGAMIVAGNTAAILISAAILVISFGASLFWMIDYASREKEKEKGFFSHGASISSLGSGER